MYYQKPKTKKDWENLANALANATPQEYADVPQNKFNDFRDQVLKATSKKAGYLRIFYWFLPMIIVFPCVKYLNVITMATLIAQGASLVWLFGGIVVSAMLVRKERENIINVGTEIGILG